MKKNLIILIILMSSKLFCQNKIFIETKELIINIELTLVNDSLYEQVKISNKQISNVYLNTNIDLNSLYAMSKKDTVNLISAFGMVRPPSFPPADAMLSGFTVIPPTKTIIFRHGIPIDVQSVKNKVCDFLFHIDYLIDASKKQPFEIKTQNYIKKASSYMTIIPINW